MRTAIGCVPIVWNNVDLPDLAPTAPHGEILDELARLGFEGTQFGRGFPEGEALTAELDRRSLRLAEWYVSLPADEGGPAAEAAARARSALARMVASGGEMLVVAVDGSPERDALSGRVPAGAPKWPEPAYDRLATLLDSLASDAPGGIGVAFHPHTASWVEAPDEVDALAARLVDRQAGLCLDVGHYIVGGGNPVEVIRRHGRLIRHVHAKDVDGEVLARLRAGELSGFGDAIRRRLFTELGRGILDLPGVVRALVEVGYSGWIMVEQDSSWRPPAEAAEIGARALRGALAGIDR